MLGKHTYIELGDCGEKLFYPLAGIYIMQNTMVRGGGKWPAGEKK